MLYQVIIIEKYISISIDSNTNFYLALTPEALSNNPSSSIFNLSFGGVVNAVKRSSAIMTEKLSSIGNDNKDWERTL